MVEKHLKSNFFSELHEPVFNCYMSNVTISRSTEVGTATPPSAPPSLKYGSITGRQQEAVSRDLLQFVSSDE